MKQLSLLLRSTFLAVALIASSAARAEYPEKPLRLLVGSAAGGASDVLGRLFAGELTKALKQQVVVENRTGAGGNIAAQEVARSAPDGYSLLLADNSMLVYSKALYSKLSYDSDRDLLPVTLLAKATMFVVVNKDFPANNLKEFAAEAKKREIPFASSGVGNPTHMGMALMSDELGIKLTHIAYRGGPPAMLDVVAGQVAGMVTSAPSFRPHVQSGRVKLLAVLADERAPEFPSVPTFKDETGKPLDATGWLALALPAGTPPAIVDRLRVAMQSFVQSPRYIQAVSDAGLTAAANTSEQFEKLLQDERGRRAMIKRVGIKAE